MEKTATWYEHRDHAELTENSNNWAWAVPEVPNDYCTKRHPALKHSPIPTHRSNKCDLKKTLKKYSVAIMF